MTSTRPPGASGEPPATGSLRSPKTNITTSESIHFLAIEAATISKFLPSNSFGYISEVEVEVLASNRFNGLSGQIEVAASMGLEV